MRDVFNRLYRTKMILSCLVLVASGIILLVGAEKIDQTNGPGWLNLLPWREFGGILIGAGVLSVWLDRYLGREQQALDELRLRQLLTEYAPVMRDAVLEAFAANHQDLARVATPEMLDQIITNSLALRLDDLQFASEIYTDIRDQAITASERWHDAHLSIELTPPPAGKGLPAEETRPRPSSERFTVTVRWEYTTIPRHAQRRFVCVSDRDEYTELTNERDSTSAWYLKPGSGMSAGDREAFALLRFSVDGEDRPIRRSARKNGQTYTANIGAEQLSLDQPVTIAYTYQVVMAASGHMLFFDIEQPTRDLKVDFDYTGCGIATVSTLDLVPSVRPTRIERTSESSPRSVIRADIDGWIFPRSGIAFVWTLESETAAELPLRKVS